MCFGYRTYDYSQMKQNSLQLKVLLNNQVDLKEVKLSLLRTTLNCRVQWITGEGGRIKHGWSKRSSVGHFVDVFLNLLWHLHQVNIINCTNKQISGAAWNLTSPIATSVTGLGVIKEKLKCWTKLRSLFVTDPKLVFYGQRKKKLPTFVSSQTQLCSSKRRLGKNTDLRKSYEATRHGQKC